MTEILTVTLNPALDLATSCPSVSPGPKLRCGPETAEPGGGGVNVARAVVQLGGQARALVALGGANGDALERLLQERDLDLIRHEAPGQTRHSFSVTDESTGAQYRFVLSGPEWTEAQLDTVLDRLAAEAGAGDYIVLSGSMPPGCAPGWITRACDRLSGRRVVVDTSGAHLHQQATAPGPAPFVLRMDSAEARDLSGLGLETRADSAAFAEALRARGAAEIVIIARGKDGSVMATDKGRWHVTAANETVVSAIGAGDSFVGGFVKALAEGLDHPEALRHGAAAAAAAVISPGTQLCLPGDFADALPRTDLIAL
ncbi:1-phosphofructokinase family hexose kinase [Mameliella sp. AT18]|uniref:1-phosphofructokinase family hexose kinase n=1 Tax=Mameliella sp. AT18 TaxID=3028385 RepID=UPI00084106C8|nr:1-phosphofructokinase family hexose kinase [Mameliella sp. AT18]MDD9731862.1 1-phosphofructokinase family hexose kinase [Mameliella sp. AT18]ODM45976.1 sugar kinase [Ruegeria sp. PBVC088]